MKNFKVSYLPFLVGGVFAGSFSGNFEFAGVWAIVGLILLATKQIKLY